MQYRAVTRCLINHGGNPDSVKVGEIRDFDVDPGKHWELVPGQPDTTAKARNTPRVTADVSAQPRTA